MAKVPTFSLIVLLFLAISLPSSSQEFSTKPSKRETRRRSERLTRLHFFSYENLRGGDVTAVVVAQAVTTNTYRTRFGEMTVFDDRLTEGPNLSSGTVGRNQGLYAEADVSSLQAYLSMFNLVFTAGDLNGSTLTVFGRYQFFPLSTVRELPILGGTGKFRLARGYVLIRTFLDEVETGISVDEYHVYAWHRY